MKYVFKVIGGVHVILAFLVLLLLLLKVLRKWLLVLILGLLRWINVYSRTRGQKQVQHNTYKQTKANTKNQYINT